MGIMIDHLRGRIGRNDRNMNVKNHHGEVLQNAAKKGRRLREILISITSSNHETKREREGDKRKKITFTEKIISHSRHFIIKL